MDVQKSSPLLGVSSGGVFTVVCFAGLGLAARISQSGNVGFCFPVSRRLVRSHFGSSCAAPFTAAILHLLVATTGLSVAMMAMAAAAPIVVIASWMVGMAAASGTWLMVASIAPSLIVALAIAGYVCDPVRASWLFWEFIDVGMDILEDLLANIKADVRARAHFGNIACAEWNNEAEWGGSGGGGHDGGAVRPPTLLAICDGPAMPPMPHPPICRHFRRSYRGSNQHFIRIRCLQAGCGAFWEFPRGEL